MTGARRILVADDDPNDRRLILRAFRKMGLEGSIDLVEDGQACLDYLQGCASSTGIPAVVVLDVKMPLVGGFDVLKAIRSQPSLHDLPVVILTSSKETRDIAQAYSLGSNAYVVKPTAFPEFLETVERLASFWVKTNEPPAIA